ncbi:hypothetical protein GCK72_000146 [Caenorhabditis remanei]|uniref:F-box associated domain-containing protein n=1 Tax=Caenorhabditis remanei TaxID=31234 RepID=A0A6A5HP20_CAERE|nr:hypothetical protein GCK72_000146 [Caenorhabditis remanei]KAF1768334.1 hypothetical protein GCK72_000146 [Caenorhabditis remanei]
MSGIYRSTDLLLDSAQSASIGTSLLLDSNYENCGTAEKEVKQTLDLIDAFCDSLDAKVVSLELNSDCIEDQMPMIIHRVRKQQPLLKHLTFNAFNPSENIRRLVMHSIKTDELMIDVIFNCDYFSKNSINCERLMMERRNEWFKLSSTTATRVILCKAKWTEQQANVSLKEWVRGDHPNLLTFTVDVIDHFSPELMIDGLEMLNAEEWKNSSVEDRTTYMKTSFEMLMAPLQHSVSGFDLLEMFYLIFGLLCSNIESLYLI